MEKLRSNMVRKAQSEVIGLLVIVIILIFLGMIYVGFVNIAGREAYEFERSSIEVENALKSLMKVKFEDYGENTLEELIINCGSGDCGGLEGAITGAYGVILRPGTDYGFLAYRDGVEIYGIKGCDIGLVSSYVFVKNAVSYEANLKIC
jgi:hypothetical protein